MVKTANPSKLWGNEKSLSAEQYYLEILEVTTEGFITIDLSGKILEVNTAYCRISGYSRAELLQLFIREIDVDDNREAVEDRIRRIINNGSDFFESRHRHKSGIMFDVELSVAFLNVHGGRLVCFCRDITGRKRDERDFKESQKALKESEARLRITIDSLPSGLVYEVDTGISGDQRKFLFISAGVKALHGLTEEEVYKDSGTIYRQIHEDDRRNLEMLEAQATTRQKIFRCEARVIMPSGETRWSLFSSAPRKRDDNHIIWHGIEIDISQQKKAEEEKRALESRLNQVQKLDSLAILAGGIAHDFNNLFAGIYGNIDLASTTSCGSKMQLYLDSAMQTIERARGLTQQLLTFSKGGAPVKKTDTLFSCIRETAQFDLTGSNVSCSFQLPEDLWPCDFDRSQIGQVIDNLIINARQAMPDGGTILISAENIVVDKGSKTLLPAGKFVRFSIKDTGIGIAKEAFANLFDPFFTTKPKGHGLGLPTCYSIISRHDGLIDFESKLGVGSTFHVYLPASDNPVVHAEINPSEAHAGAGTILLMDDEEILRETISGMLQSLGYSVVATENGKQAMDFFASELKAGRKIVSMIFDLTIPGSAGGKETIGEIRKLCLEIPVIVVSGYANDPIMANPHQYGFTASLCKPFKKDDLARVLNTAIRENRVG